MKTTKKIFKHNTQIAPNRFLTLFLVEGVDEPILDYDYHNLKDEMQITLLVPLNYTGELKTKDTDFLKRFRYPNMVSKCLTTCFGSAKAEYEKVKAHKKSYEQTAARHNLPVEVIMDLKSISNILLYKRLLKNAIVSKKYPVSVGADLGNCKVALDYLRACIKEGRLLKDFFL